MNSKCIRRDDLCWLYYPINKYKNLGGDYAYAKLYAPRVSEKLEDGRTYLKIRIKDIWWAFNGPVFHFQFVNADATLSDYCRNVVNPELITVVE